MGWLTTIIIGIIAGWLAGQISKNHGFGIWGDLIVGIIGSFIGNMLLGIMGFAAYGIIGNIIAATVGALVLLWVIRLFRPAEPAYKK
ncbi:MAG: GlsB/YeaQ/YmgE family stress response membrane protein [Pelosinus sp.]|nr:GlsB/YeaQ/YmgE family stress response membrane protein [Pelosinus sp.]